MNYVELSSAELVQVNYILPLLVQAVEAEAEAFTVRLWREDIEVEDEFYQSVLHLGVESSIGPPYQNVHTVIWGDR
jgi:hypothetical protein